MNVFPVQGRIYPLFQANPVTINGKKFIPRTEFKGPILKLTKNDMKKIQDYRSRIAELELQQIKLGEQLSAKFIGIDKQDYFLEESIKIEEEIRMLENLIETIKVERLGKQITDELLKD